MKAFVLVNTELGYENQLMDALKGIKEITATHVIFGIYDLLLEIESDSMDNIRDIVWDKIRDHDHVIKSITLMTKGNMWAR